MTMLPFVVAVWLLLVGLYGIATSRNTIHLVSCLFVAQSSTYVFLIAIGYRRHGTAPILSGLPPGAPLVDPVVQSLALTDIVVTAHGLSPYPHLRHPGPQEERFSRPPPVDPHAGLIMATCPRFP